MLKKYLQYSAERFPLAGVILYAGSLFWMSYSFSGTFRESAPWSLPDVIVGFLVFFMVFLHLRIFDEHKDFEKDRIAYPERMLSRGEITLRDLRHILYPVLALEFVLSLVLGVRVVIAWVLILLWTLFMLKEFFVPVFLNKRIGLYLISHQLLVPIMTAFPALQRRNLLDLSKNEWAVFVLFSFGTMCLTMTYEIARKTWSAQRENANADSYTRAWGIGRTAVISILVSALAFAIFTYLLYGKTNIVPIIVNSALLSIFISAEIVFLITKTTGASKIVEYAGIMYMLGMFISMAIAYTFQ